MRSWRETLDDIPSIAVPRILRPEPVQGVGRFLRLERSVVEYPDGRTHPWESVSRPQRVVSVLASTRDRTLVLIAGYRPLLGRWYVTLPSGLVESDQTPERACRDELRQETGYVGDRVDYLLSSPSSPGLTDETAIVHHMPDVEPHPDGQDLEPTEIIEVLRVPLAELDAFMLAVMALPELYRIDAKIDQAVACARRMGLL